jgi:hypothetical protein
VCLASAGHDVHVTAALRVSDFRHVARVAIAFTQVPVHVRLLQVINAPGWYQQCCLGALPCSGIENDSTLCLQVACRVAADKRMVVQWSNNRARLPWLCSLSV